MYRSVILRNEDGGQVAAPAAAPADGAADNTSAAAAPSAEQAPEVQETSKAKQPGETNAEHAKRIAAILKKESALLQKERSMQEKYAEVERRAVELEQRYGKLNSTKDELKNFVLRMRDNPVQFLKEEFGFGPEEYFKYAQNGGEPPPEAKIEREIATLREQLEQERHWRSTFEEELARKTKEYQTEAERRQREYYEQQQNEAATTSQQEFMSLVRTDNSKFPELQFYSDDDILASAAEYVTMLSQQGSIDGLTYEDVAQALHKNAVEWHSKLRQQKAAQAVEVAKTSGDSKVVASSLDEDFEGAIKKTSKPESKAKKVVRNPDHEPYGQTLNGNMTSARTTAKTKLNSMEDERARLIKELESMP